IPTGVRRRGVPARRGAQHDLLRYLRHPARRDRPGAWPMRLHEYVMRAPDRDALAISGPDGSLSYGELDALADRYAGALRDRGVRPGDRVVLWTGKSIHAVAAMQGALRIGALYVPVTDTNPAARVDRIASDCTAALVLADRERDGALTVAQLTGVP